MMREFSDRVPDDGKPERRPWGSIALFGLIGLLLLSGIVQALIGVASDFLD